MDGDGANGNGPHGRPTATCPARADGGASSVLDEQQQDEQQQHHGQLRSSQRRVLQALSWSDGLTRTALASQLAMPKATVTGLVDSLIARGLVLEGPAAYPRGRAGRPAKVLSAAGPSPTAAVAVLSGGTLSAAVVTYAGQVLTRASAGFTNPENDPEAVEVVVDLLNQVIGSASQGIGRPAGHGPAVALAELGLPVAGPTAVVLGVAAPFIAHRGVTPFQALRDETGLTPKDIPGYLPWLNGGVIGRLGKVFGVPVLVENDANLGALGEATFGAGQGQDSFVFLKLAKGVGAGIVIGGRLHRGETGFAGELGHVHVRDDGPLCRCGGRGCLFSILGDALVQQVQPAYEQPLTFTDVLDLAANGEPGPRRVLGDLGRALGRPLADFATLLNPGALIVDGSFAPAVEHVVAGIRESIDRYAAPVAAAAVSVRAGTLGEDAEFLGGAVLSRAKHAEKGALVRA